jgi:hypothetical protein
MINHGKRLHLWRRRTLNNRGTVADEEISTCLEGEDDFVDGFDRSEEEPPVLVGLLLFVPAAPDDDGADGGFEDLELVPRHGPD